MERRPTSATRTDTLVPVTTRFRSGSVAAVGPCGALPDGEKRIDWSAFTVLPGRSDLHTHLADLGQSADLAAPMKASPAETALVGARNARVTLDAGFTSVRSEEHTSELQSLMRSSYADFCLQKKKQNVSATIVARTRAYTSPAHRNAAPHKYRTQPPA